MDNGHKLFSAEIFSKEPLSLPLISNFKGDYGTKDIQVPHYGIWPWRRILNGACISISNLPENIAWQTHGPEARGPPQERGLGRSPHLPPSNTAPGYVRSSVDTTRRIQQKRVIRKGAVWIRIVLISSMRQQISLVILSTRRLVPG